MSTSNFLSWPSILLNRNSVIAACEQSLRRLRTDYIDLYWLHNWDKHTPIEETMATLHDLVQSGKVRYIGISDTPAWKVTQAHAQEKNVGLEVTPFEQILLGHGALFSLFLHFSRSVYFLQHSQI